MGQAIANSNAIAAATAASAPIPASCTPAVTADCLRALPDTVVRTQLAVEFNKVMASPPSVDLKVLPKTIKQIFIDGTNSKVPVLNGTNENEYTLLIAIGELARRAAATPPNFDPTNQSFLLSAAGLSSHGGRPGRVPGRRGESDAHHRRLPVGQLSAPTRHLQPALAAEFARHRRDLRVQRLQRVQARAGPGLLIYAYEFRDQTAIPSIGRNPANQSYYFSMPQGAGHRTRSSTCSSSATAGRPRVPAQAALASAMASYWTNFARSGNPNGAGVPAWADFGAGAVLGLDVAAGGSIAPLTSAAFAAARSATPARSGARSRSGLC